MYYSLMIVSNTYGWLDSCITYLLCYGVGVPPEHHLCCPQAVEFLWASSAFFKKEHCLLKLISWSVLDFNNSVKINTAKPCFSVKKMWGILPLSSHNQCWEIENRKEVRSKTWRLHGTCLTPTLLLGGWVPRVFAAAGRYWHHWSCASVESGPGLPAWVGLSLPWLEGQSFGSCFLLKCSVLVK